MSQRRTLALSSRLLQLLIVAIALIVVLSLLWVLLSPNQKNYPSATEERSWDVNVLKVKLGRYSPSIQIFGQITTQSENRINATITAYIDQINVDEGDSVQPNQLLLSLDRSDLELEYQQKLGAKQAIQADIQAEKARYLADQIAINHERSLVALTKRAVERHQASKEKSLSSGGLLEEAERAYQQQLLSLNNRQLSLDDHPNRLAKLEAKLLQAQAELDKTRLNIKRTEIKAPFAARINKISVTSGEHVNQGTPLLQLYPISTLELKGQIPSQYLPIVRQSLSTNKPVIAETLINQQGITFNLDRLDSEFKNGQEGTYGFFKTETVLEDANALTLGRSFPLLLKLPSINNAVFIPPQALYGTDRVYKVQEGRLVAVTIERLGEAIEDGEYGVLISSPKLLDGDEIVTTQLPTAAAGLKVNKVATY